MKKINCCFLFLLVFFGCGDDDELVKDEVIEDKPNKKITWKKDGKEMALIPAGSFEMGNHFYVVTDGENTAPVHKVTLNSFYMDVHEVTVAQFREFVNQSGYDYQANMFLNLFDMWDEVARDSPGDNHPMVRVNWNDAVAYAEWAGKRLPTEAEWEYAARGGLVGKRYPWGDKEPTPDRANYGSKVGKPTVVGSYPANGYGLHDMAGNVWEWCQDWYEAGYYSNSPVNNPQGPKNGRQVAKMIRGGQWGSVSSVLQVHIRGHSLVNLGPQLSVNNGSYSKIGFRCVSGSK